MRKFYTFILIICTLCTAYSVAKEYKVDDVPMVHLADRSRYVSNPDNILSATTVSEIDRILFVLEQKTGIQTSVVVIEKIEGGDCFDFAYNLGRKHGIGQKGKDNGLVVLLSTSDRCIQFSTGYGLEGILPDAICKKIQIRYMNKAFANNNWDAGMLAGMKALNNILINKKGSPDNNKESGNNYGLFIALIATIGITLLYLFINVRRNKRCPQCHNQSLKVISSRTIEKYSTYHIDEVVICCSHCGHIIRKEVRIDDDDNLHNGRRGFGGGIFMGGLGSGFGRGSGGFDGGSFGGGDFGGGGAGSKF